MPVLVSLFKL